MDTETVLSLNWLEPFVRDKAQIFDRTKIMRQREKILIIGLKDTYVTHPRDVWARIWA